MAWHNTIEEMVGGEENIDDPLGLKELAIRYDYLMFKIQDRISSLADQTYQSVLAKQTAIEDNYFKEQLNLDSKIDEINKVVDSCNELELEFMKLEQIEGFINDFKQRLVGLEREYNKLL